MNTSHDESSGSEQKGKMKVLKKRLQGRFGVGEGEAEAGNAKV